MPSTITLFGSRRAIPPRSNACGPNDPAEDEKIESIATNIDRYFSLLQLQSAYDSNDFANSLYDISVAIREKRLPLPSGPHSMRD